MATGRSSLTCIRLWKLVSKNGLRAATFPSHSCHSCPEFELHSSLLWPRENRKNITSLFLSQSIRTPAPRISPSPMNFWKHQQSHKQASSTQNKHMQKAWREKALKGLEPKQRGLPPQDTGSTSRWQCHPSDYNSGKTPNKVSRGWVQATQKTEGDDYHCLCSFILLTLRKNGD